MNDELGSLYKKAVVTSFKLISDRFSGIIKEIEASFIQDRGFRVQFRNQTFKMGTRCADNLEFTQDYSYSC